MAVLLEFKAKVVALEAKGFDKHIMSFYCFIFGFFFLSFIFFSFFGVAAKCPPFYTDIQILVLNHNHLICIPSLLCTHTHTHTHTHTPCLLQVQKVPTLFFCTDGHPNAQSFQASLHLCTNYKRAWGWSGEAKMLGKLSVPGRPTNLDNNRAKGLLRL